MTDASSTPPAPPPATAVRLRHPVVTGLFIGALVAGVGLRLWAWNSHAPRALVVDEACYLKTAETFYDTGRIDSIARAPGYPVFIAAVFALLPLDLLGCVYAGQTALAAAAIALLFLLGQRFARPAVGLLAAWLYALDPTMIAYTLFVFSEPLNLTLMLLATLLFLSGRQRASPRYLAIAGLVFGLASLVRSQTLVLAPLLLIWTLKAPRRSWFSGAACRARLVAAAGFALAWAAVVLPWTYRNYREFGAIILVDTTAARTLWHANHISYRPGYAWPFGEYLSRPGREVPSEENDSAAEHGPLLRRELRFMADNPGLILMRIPEKLAALWNPTSYLTRHLSRDWMAGWSRRDGSARVASLVNTGFYAVVLVPAVFGLMHGRRTDALWLFCAVVVLSTLAVHSVMVCQSRYRLPAMPYVMLLAASALCCPRRHFHPQSWRTWTAAALAALLVWSWIAYWPLVDVGPLRPG